jgi:hypothetical protein
MKAPAAVIPGSTRDPSGHGTAPPWTPGQARGDRELA